MVRVTEGCVTLSPVVVLCVGLAIGGALFGSCQASRATEAEIRLQDALAQHRGSLDAWEDERTGLTRRLGALQRDSGALALRYEGARRSAAVARHRGDSLLALLPDTLRVAVRLTFDSLSAETAACDAVLRNCELRAANAEARAQGDSIHLVETAKLLLTTEGQWRMELQRNRPGFLGMRAFWHARSWTIPLAAVTTLLVLQRH